MTKKQLMDELYILKMGHADGYAAIDVNGLIEECNPVFKEMLGYTDEEIKNVNYKDLSPKKWRSIEAKIIQEQVVAGHYSKVHEKEYLRRDGSIIPIELRVCLRKDVKGEYNGYWVFVRDISERRKADEAIRESERRWADIIDFLPDATLAIDLEGRVIAWNRAIEKMTGVAAANMLGKDNYEYALPFFGVRRPIMVDLVLNPDKKLEKLYDVTLIRQKDLLIVETWNNILPSGPICTWGKASPLYNSKGNVVGAIESIRDVTQRKEAEEMLKKRENDLKLKSSELQELNIALRVLLKQRDDDRHELEERMLCNAKLLIQPFLDKLRNHADPKGRSYVNVIESNLNDILSPFARKLFVEHLNLSNKEVQVADLIKNGKTTKEIAEIINASESSVNIHRYRIRKKLGLKKTQNLLSYLSSLT
jgi:PAS domain S-box-containing protein